MSRITKIIAAAVLAAGFATSAHAAQVDKSFPGIVIVPASANPMQEEAPAQAKPASLEAQFKRAKIVAYATADKPGSIYISTKEHALYFVLPGGKAAKYRVATAKPGFEWSGSHTIEAKTTWPDWRPPAEMRIRRPELPAYMAGGPKNPLGARAMYIAGTIYRIHGTNEPSSIGKPASSGCIRMLNEDVSELYKFVKLGAKVTVI
jgi:lipoprotein-anchoring transpeptidase ErfK/SrfK